MTPDHVERASASPVGPTTEFGSEPSAEPDDYDTATMFGSGLVLLLGLVFYLARLGFHTAISSILETVGAALFLVSLPGVFRQTTVSPASPGIRRPLAFHGWLTLLAAAVLAACGMLPSAVTAIVAIPIAVAGALCAGIVTVRWAGRRTMKSALTLACLASVFGLWSAAVVWGGGYMHPLAPELLLAGGSVQPDTLFHAAISAMWQTYGLPSTGLDGTPYLAYHYGSHWLIAQFGHLVGVDPFRAYQLVYPVIVIPWLFVSMFRFALDVRPLLVAPARWRPLLRSHAFWLILIAGVIGILPGDWLQEISSSYRPILSQSYTLALTVAFLTASVIVWLWRFDPPAGDHGEVGDRPQGVLIVLWVLLPALDSLLGFLKISLLGIFVGLQLFLLWRLRLYRSMRYLVAAGILLAGFVITYRLTNFTQGSGVGGLLSLPAMGYRVLWIAKNYFIPIHWMWTILYAVLRLQQEGARTLTDLWRLVSDRRILDVEILFVVALLGLGPQIALNTGDNGYYFSDVQRWLALGLLLGGVGASIGRMSWSSLRDVAMRPASLVIGLLLVSAATAVALNIALPASAMFRTEREVRSALSSPPQRGFSPRVALLGSGQVEVAEQKGPNRDEVVDLLFSLRSLSRGERARTLLYVPRSTHAFWERPNTECWATPFLAPALSGIAMLDGLPAPPCSQAMFGYQSYHSGAYRGGARDLTVAEICQRASIKGMSRILVLDTAVEGHVALREIRCAATG